MAARLTPLVVPAGHNVVQEGDDAESLFLLQEGTVVIFGHLLNFTPGYLHEMSVQHDLAAMACWSREC